MLYKNFSFIQQDGLATPVFSLLDMGHELHSSARYTYDNMDRGDYEGYILQYTLSGQGFYRYGETNYTLEAGDCFFIKVPSDSAYYYTENSKEPWDLIYLHMDGLGVEAYYNRFHELAGPVAHLTAYCQPIEEIFALHEQLVHDTILEPFEAATQVCTVLGALLKVLMAPSDISPIDEDYMKKALQIIHDDYGTLSSIESIAERLQISHAHFSRLFKKSIGQSPASYLTKIRLQHAASLLLGTHDNINTIARQVGYDNGNYFGKVFSQVYGMSPRVYRRRR